VSKQSKPGKQTVELRPSRIRREPVRLDAPAPPRSREREMLTALAGVAVIAAASAGLILGFSEVTSHERAAAAAPVNAAFGFCRKQPSPNCVLDGETFFVAGSKVRIAAIDAPRIHGAGCRAEARLGVHAAVRLHQLLNRGPVTITDEGRGRDHDGRLLRKVEVQGADVAPMMIDAGVARDSEEGPRPWC